MTPEIALDVFRTAMQLVVIIVGAILLPGLVVGLIVAVFQAATSINEQTLSFLPRLAVTLITFAVLMHWIFEKIIFFTQDLIHSIPELIG
ncbi:MAG: flagellar biosynthetic protein FliQ [Gammaproteobacteria bacterium CG22_combo_CG10-13_8_21_14_all_40_8]|nr:MAG: flagellar biosynthetic protein FliQ [Gammaproteobacteria bacterium CG22_combo_CG10-13_8_21_14_all_40_8]